MRIIDDDLPPFTDIPIIELGGTVHYSLEMRAYLARLPRDEADRIVREIEYRNRPRRVIDWDALNRGMIAKP